MRKFIFRAGRAALVCIGCGALASGCGSARPVAPTFKPVLVGGEWVGEQQVTRVAGGECVTQTFEDVWQLPSQFHASIVQTGIGLTVVANLDHTGATCTYTGAIDGNAISLTMTSCTESKLRNVACADGTLRDVLPNVQNLHATVTGDAITGTAVENDIVVAAGQTARLANLDAVSSFSLQRR